MMDIILLERIEKLGQMGDVVKVRPGYARNFLLPRKKALRATKQNIAYFETQKTQLEASNLKRRQEAEDVAAKLDGLSVVLIRQAGASGQLYGSVTARDIAEAVVAAGFTIGRDQVRLDVAIKSLCLLDVRVVLHPEVSVKININIARSHDEAEMQAERGGAVTQAELLAEEDSASAAAFAAERQAAITESEDGEQAASAELPA
jgi:large subunit ribosomal protein L9